MNKSKKGNITIVVVAVFTVLTIVLGSFIKTSINRSHNTKIASDTLYTKEIANSIAVLTVHFLKSQLRNSNSNNPFATRVKKLFSATYNSCNGQGFDIRVDDIDIRVQNNNLIRILEGGSDLKDVKVKNIHCSLENVRPLNAPESNPYTREKIGNLIITFDINYKKAGASKTETYRFSTDFKVVANLLPVLSKFTLYIENLLKDFNDPNARKPKPYLMYNVISTDINGQLTNREGVKPWVLNNVGESEEDNTNRSKPKTYKELVEDARGFVYLGGGEADSEHHIQLGIAFSDPETDGVSPLGEDFHFYKKLGEGDYIKNSGLWNQNPDDEQIGVANIGLCNDQDEAYQEYWDFLGEEIEYKDYRFNSIFKLYGTDKMYKQKQIFSPTLVFGYVDSMYASIRLFLKGPESSREHFKLPFYSDDADGNGEDSFLAAIEDGEEITDFYNFYNDSTGQELNFNPDYINFMSKIEHIPYNMDYAYAYDNKIPHPFTETFSDSDDFKKLCLPDSEPSIFIEIPKTEKANFRDIYTGCDLTKLDNFIDNNKLFKGIENDEESIVEAQNNRISHYLKLLPSNTDTKGKNSIIINNIQNDNEVEKSIKDYLYAKGILLDKGYPSLSDVNDENTGLDFNGWLYINSDGVDSFDLNINFDGRKLLSHGGIVLSKGNIVIRNDILAKENNNAHLTLIALDGDIIVEGIVNRLDASLITKTGSVKLKDGNDKLILNGNIVMNNTGMTNSKDIKNKEGMKRGLLINYKHDLSAIPNDTIDDKKRTEVPLLMFSIKDNPKFSY